MHDFKESSTSSLFLNERERVNRENSSFDFDGWFNETLNKLGDKKTILDIFCGRGKQLRSLKNAWPSSVVTGVDISKDSIDFIEKNIVDVNSVCIPVEDFVSSSKESGKKWDLISAFYGLYYASNQQVFLHDLANLVNKNGHLIVCGPYGDNNKKLYGMLESYQEIDEFVLHTSNDYMDSVVIPELSKYEFNIQVETRVNSISYKSSDEVIRYLESTTFYNRKNCLEVKVELDEYFKENKVFSVDKHIKMLVCEKI